MRDLYMPLRHCEDIAERHRLGHGATGRRLRGQGSIGETGGGWFRTKPTTDRCGSVRVGRHGSVCAPAVVSMLHWGDSPCGAAGCQKPIARCAGPTREGDVDIWYWVSKSRPQAFMTCQTALKYLTEFHAGRSSHVVRQSVAVAVVPQP
jgi:hypothetical protein